MSCINHYIIVIYLELKHIIQCTATSTGSLCQCDGKPSVNDPISGRDKIFGFRRHGIHSCMRTWVLSQHVHKDQNSWRSQEGQMATKSFGVSNLAPSTTVAYPLDPFVNLVLICGIICDLATLVLVLSLTISYHLILHPFEHGDSIHLSMVTRPSSTHFTKPPGVSDRRGNMASHQWKVQAEEQSLGLT